MVSGLKLWNDEMVCDFYNLFLSSLFISFTSLLNLSSHHHIFISHLFHISHHHHHHISGPAVQGLLYLLYEIENKEHSLIDVKKVIYWDEEGLVKICDEIGDLNWLYIDLRWCWIDWILMLIPINDHNPNNHIIKTKNRKIKRGW